MRNSLKIFWEDLNGSLRDLLPIILVITLFQVFVIREVPGNLGYLVLGLAIVAVGLALFIRGLELGIFPLGENLAHDFARKGSLVWLLLFAFLVGFSTTIAEPALIAIAEKAQIISCGRIDAFGLRMTVALSVGCAIALGAFRIILGHPVHFYIVTGYILVVAVTFFAPPEIVGLAYDSGGVTTSTVTVPLVTALGIGLATSIRGRNPVIDGFGLIAFASLTPMIFVQVYGIVVYQLSDPAAAQAVAKTATVALTHTFGAMRILHDLLGVVTDVLPILGVILFFQYLVIKKAVPHKIKTLIGFVLVILGLDFFIMGLELGLFPLGEEMAEDLTGKGADAYWLIYLFAFAIGFATTMAEPALIAVAMKVEEISQKRIRQMFLRIAVAIGVAAGIALGAYRIVVGDSIQYYIIAGYVIVIIMTYFAPRYIIPIAYDSGGVTTSTVTVPLVAALGLGLATNIPDRSVLIDGFGLIAFASLFPMITVMGYAILIETMTRRDL